MEGECKMVDYGCSNDTDWEYLLKFHSKKPALTIENDSQNDSTTPDNK